MWKRWPAEPARPVARSGGPTRFGWPPANAHAISFAARWGVSGWQRHRPLAVDEPSPSPPPLLLPLLSANPPSPPPSPRRPAGPGLASTFPTPLLAVVVCRRGTRLIMSAQERMGAWAWREGVERDLCALLAGGGVCCGRGGGRADWGVHGPAVMAQQGKCCVLANTATGTVGALGTVQGAAGQHGGQRPDQCTTTLCKPASTHRAPPARRVRHPYHGESPSTRPTLFPRQHRRRRAPPESRVRLPWHGTAVIGTPGRPQWGSLRSKGSRSCFLVLPLSEEAHGPPWKHIPLMVVEDQRGAQWTLSPWATHATDDYRRWILCASFVPARYLFGGAR